VFGETRRGTCSDCGLMAEAWTRIATRLASDGRSKKQIRDKVRRLKIQHNIYDTLVNKSGFGYNPSDGSRDVPDDVWSRYVSANPGAAAYENRPPLESSSELHESFNRAVATGEFVISTLVAAPMSDVGGVTNDLGIENVAAASVPRTETMVSDGGRGSVDGGDAAQDDRAAALDAPALRSNLLGPSDRQTGKRKTRGSGAVLAETVSYYARVLEKTLEHNALPTPVQVATMDLNQRFSNVFDAYDRARYISHFADHPRFAEVCNVADIAIKWALLSGFQLQHLQLPPPSVSQIGGAVHGILSTRAAFCLLVK
jgi:hypothetical protein